MYGADGRSVEARLDEIENLSQTVQAVPFAAKDGACHSSTLPKFDDLISAIAFVVPLGQTNITQALEVQLVVGFFQINYVSNTASAILHPPYLSLLYLYKYNKDK